MYVTYALYTQFFFFTNHPYTILVTYLKRHSVLRELCCCYVMNGPDDDDTLYNTKMCRSRRIDSSRQPETGKTFGVT